MRPVLVLAAFMFLAYTLPAHANDPFDEVDSLYGSKKSCDTFDYSCKNKSNERKIFNDDDGEKKQDKPKSDNSEDNGGPRGYLDPPKKSNSIGDSIREQLKPR